jgi:hypothetical protein
MPRAPRRSPPTTRLEVGPEDLEELWVQAAVSTRAFVRDQPLAALGGAACLGFVVGGGWRTRVGRLIVANTLRYALLRTAQNYLA